MTTGIAFFITSHGFGHAARTAAVVEALGRLRPEIDVHLFTTVPRWFFDDSLTRPFRLHRLETDIGLVQKNSLEEDPLATYGCLRQFLPFSQEHLRQVSRELEENACRLVVADISPLALAVAAAAGRPSVLVESFTWDWIYAAYLHSVPRLAEFIPQLTALFAAADLRIQTEPLCRREAASALVGPIWREPRLSANEVRDRLNLEVKVPMVLLTMGGIEWSFRFLDRLQERTDLAFVVPGGATEPETRGNLHLLPHRSGFHHPDLVAAADLVVGKLGYSTLAETYRAGTPAIFVQRPDFPESTVLARFAHKHLPCVEISPHEFEDASWLDRIGDLLTAERPAWVADNGADAAATLIAKMF